MGRTSTSEEESCLWHGLPWSTPERKQELSCNLRRYTAELPTRQELACSPAAGWPSGRAITRGRPAGRLLLLPVSAAAAGAGPSGAAPLEAARGLVKDSDLVEEEMVLVPGSRPASMNRAPRSSVM